MKTLVLIPAHNEQDSIGKTIESVLNQIEKADKIVVIANGCTDNTAKIAKKYPVKVMDLPPLAHRKSEALNVAWNKYKDKIDLVISMDADTELPPNAILDWKKEMENPLLGGSSSKFTILKNKDLLSKLQKAEYSAWIDKCLKDKTTTVLSGTGCAIRAKALREVEKREDREGPWTYNSQVEDFELTYRIKEAGYKTHVSPTVRAYTDSMTSIKTLWRQRMKWQVGTIEDLFEIGYNKHTRKLWFQQLFNLIGISMTILWALIFSIVVALGQFQFRPIWLILPALVIALDLKKAMRIPERDKKDLILAALWLPSEFFILFRQAVILISWKEFLFSKVFGKKKDRWAIQYKDGGK